MLIFAKNIKKVWLPTCICYDIYKPMEYYYVTIEYNCHQKLIKEIYTSSLYGHYLSMVGLVEKLSYI